jgi:hypothetical protein
MLNLTSLSKTKLSSPSRILQNLLSVACNSRIFFFSNIKRRPGPLHGDSCINPYWQVPNLSFRSTYSTVVTDFGLGTWWWAPKLRIRIIVRSLALYRMQPNFVPLSIKWNWRQFWKVLISNYLAIKLRWRSYIHSYISDRVEKSLTALGLYSS